MAYFRFASGGIRHSDLNDGGACAGDVALLAQVLDACAGSDSGGPPMQIVIDEIDIGTPSEEDTDPEELSVEEQATVVAALDRDRCGLLRRENSMAEASSAMADETTVVREWGSRSYSITDLPFDAEVNRHCVLIIINSVGSLNRAQTTLGQTCRYMHTWFSSRFEHEETSIPSRNTSALTNKEETQKPEEGKASAGITLTPTPATTETTTKDRNAIRALEAAAAASGHASLVEASRLIHTEGAQNAAYALVVTMAAANSCNAKARPVMRTAERAVREVVVSRCCSWPQLRDRSAFLEAVKQAFGSPLDRELRALLLVTYHKAVREKLAEPASVQVLAKQLRMSIGILLRDAVPDFPQRIAEFLSQHALSAEMVSATPSGGSTLSATVTRLA